jgi:hypothetical protein
MTAEHRQAAQDRLTDLTRVLQSAGDTRTASIVAECDALSRAIAAFHMEGIRFRMYNVDRLLRDYVGSNAAEGGRATNKGESALAVLEDVRHHLEAAGFHTRSHQAPL